MSWTAPTTDAFLAQFNPAELERIQDLQSDPDAPEMLLARTVAEVRQNIRGGGYSLDDDATLVPDGLHNDLYALMRGRFIASLPAAALDTPARTRELDEAIAKFKRIADGKETVEAPASEVPLGDRAGTWNSENKLIMRTHPTPRPATQMQPSTTMPAYANPVAPPDRGV